jgi:HEAT repeat protein
MWDLKLVKCVVVCCLWGALAIAQEADDIESPKHKAWDMLLTASLSKRTSESMNRVRALGLLKGNSDARQVAEQALGDRNADVRRAAATALGQMHAKESIPKLEGALSDKPVPVVMAAAQSLRELEDARSAYSVYYDLLTGERKSNDALIAQQLQTLKDPKQLAEIGFSEGIGFVPVRGDRMGCVADHA